MRFVINLFVLVVLIGSTQTRGQSSVVPPLFTPGRTGASASPDPTEDPGSEVPGLTHNPTGRNETSTEPTAAATETHRTFYYQTTTSGEYTTNMFSTSSAQGTTQQTDTPAPTTQPDESTASNSNTLSFTPTLSSSESTVLLTSEPLTTFSSQDASSTGSVSLTTALTQLTTTGSAPARAAGPTHQEAPSELNVGDEDFKGPRLRPSSPLDPLLAGLLSVFIVTTAIVFVILFLKFRQRTNHPEFHRLQDLPMDDLMEDTPLSRYSY